MKKISNEIMENIATYMDDEIREEHITNLHHAATDDF